VISDPALITESGNVEHGSLGSSTPFLTTSESEAPAETLRFAPVSRAQRDRPPNERKNGPFGRPALTFLVLALPALWVGWLIYHYGVDTPFGDEWDSTWLLLEKMQAGTLGFGDFFAFQNEHRIFFPRLLTLALAKLSHWNVRAELLMIWILACVCSLNLWRVAQITGWRNSRARHWLLLGTNILLLSPLQWENLLWGFQIVFFLPLATMTACLWVAPSLRRPYDFLATMALCLISTFSFASGFASWLLTAPLLLLWNRKTRARGEKSWWLIWASAGIVSVCFYFHGFAKPAAHPSPMLAVEHPLLAAQFLLAYLGSPFCVGTVFKQATIAQIAGAALVIALLVSVVYLWRCRRDRTLVAHSLPWLSLTSIALVNGVLIMLGRLGFGIFAATSSRYVSFAIMLPIGLLFLGSLVFRHWREQSDIGEEKVNPGRLVVLMTAVLVTVLSLLFVCGTIESLEFCQRFQHNCLSGKAGLLLINVIDEPGVLARHVHWAGPSLKGWANALDHMGYLRPTLVRSNRIREIAFRADAESMGEFNELGKSLGGNFAARGWAILPKSHRIADGVLLTYDNAQGDPIIFALAEVGGKRPEVSRHFNDKTYLDCGWMKAWKAGQIPASSQVIRAWTFDAEKCRAFQIGAFSFDPPKAAE
jgi:hypothetical protein